MPELLRQLSGHSRQRVLPESEPILFRTRRYVDLSVICERHVNDAGVTAHRAVFDVFLIRSRRWINRNHDLFSADIADVAGFIVHCQGSITVMTGRPTHCAACCRRLIRPFLRGPPVQCNSGMREQPARNCHLARQPLQETTILRRP